ncbi:MAG: hypothetical protein IPK33_10930 [Gemmatimonadetes bacterium]|nr:hypothetical protein [Gemmatimonadota bacterium]
MEFAIPSGANTLSEGGGVAGVNEIDLVAQYAHKAGPALLSVGATRYEYSGHNRVLTTSYNTTEIFLGSRLDNVWGDALDHRQLGRADDPRRVCRGSGRA